MTAMSRRTVLSGVASVALATASGVKISSAEPKLPVRDLPALLRTRFFRVESVWLPVMVKDYDSVSSKGRLTLGQGMRDIRLDVAKIGDGKINKSYRPWEGDQVWACYHESDGAREASRLAASIDEITFEDALSRETTARRLLDELGVWEWALPEGATYRVTACPYVSQRRRFWAYDTSLI